MFVEITQYRNAKALDLEATRFDVEINHPEFGWIPYTLDPSDTDMTIDNAVLLELIGSDYEAATQAEIDDRQAALVRFQRDAVLSTEVDPIVSNPLRWADMTTEQQNAWSQYRTDLLNITDQDGFPHDVTWPTKP
jgi:hypothetical protein